MDVKQIKTVTAPIERAEWFDTSVNKLLSEGWTITKRSIIHTPGELSEAFNAPIDRLLYAELECHVPPYPEETTI